MISDLSTELIEQCRLLALAPTSVKGLLRAEKFKLRTLLGLGFPLESLLSTMRDRVTEYIGDRKWCPSDGEELADTLVWQAAKHVGELLHWPRDPWKLPREGIQCCNP